jgi:hypothetical protein
MADSAPPNNTAAGTNTDSKFLLQLRDQMFHVEVWMYNQIDNNFKPFAIPTYFIEALAIEETLMTWTVKGWIVLANDFEILERGAISTEINSQVKAPFAFRTDGRNKISIRIFPIINTENSVENSKGLPSEYWEMQYDFVIYDIEDLQTESAAKKLRKFYFWDERFQIFTERNVEWSTADNVINPYATMGAKDELRTIPASLAIKSIIQAASSNTSDVTKHSDIKVGSTKGPQGIAEPDIPLDNFDDNNWDEGSEDSLIFYTSPANNCVLEDLSYISENLKASDGSCLFLGLDRYTKRWSLIPLTKFFENASNNQIERLVIQDNQALTQTEQNKQSMYTSRAPFKYEENSPIKNFQSSIASKILTYKFSPMVATDDIRITNAPIHNYNFSSSEYNIYFKENSVEKFLDKMKKSAGSQNNTQNGGGLYSFNRSNQLLLNLNQTKTKGLMLSNNFIPRTFFPKDASSVSMMKDFLFLNQAIYFSAPGLTFRTPGKFVFIDRDASSAEINPFDDRFLGQWMLVRVVHMFTKDKYVTDVVATKIDSHEKWWEELDSKNSNGDKY